MRAQAIVAALAMAGGCATVLPSGVRASGEPLKVDVRDESFTVPRSVPVGQVTYRDSTGRSVGTATVSETQMVTMRDVRWRGMQGDHVISDEDLLRIAGDPEAADIDRSYRRSGRIMFWTGCALAAAGLAGSLLSRDREWLETTPGRVTAGLSYGGFLGGVFLLEWGVRRLHPDRHPVPLERARDASERYNAHLSTTLGAQP